MKQMDIQEPVFMSYGSIVTSSFTISFPCHKNLYDLPKYSIELWNLIDVYLKTRSVASKYFSILWFY